MWIRTALLVFGALVFVSGILYLRFDMSKVEFGGLYHLQFIASSYLQIKRTLQVVQPLQGTQDKNCSGGTLMYGQYCVISPYENELRNTSKVGSVTLCTQGTVEFLQHVVVLCHRWSDPISVAVYSPREYYVDTTSWSQGIYPINVGRNVAMRLAPTPFVFSTDIKLYPSRDIPVKFERMLRSQILSPDNQVWVLPVFEVHSSARAPLLKFQLKSMYAKKQAISFHQYVCKICHRIPNLTQWMSHGEGLTVSEVEESLEPLRIWATVKRSRDYKRLSWEGKQDKMQMAYEMCMRDYDFHIVENAFLVHAPGINVYNATQEKNRSEHLAQNQRVIDMIENGLIQKYGSEKHYRVRTTAQQGACLKMRRTPLSLATSIPVCW